MTKPISSEPSSRKTSQDLGAEDYYKIFKSLNNNGGGGANSRSNSVINNNNAQSEDQQQPKNNNKSLLTSAREKSIDDEFEALFDEAEQDEMEGKIRSSGIAER